MLRLFFLPLLLGAQEYRPVFADALTGKPDKSWEWVRPVEGAAKPTSNGMQLRVLSGTLWAKDNSGSNMIVRAMPAGQAAATEITVTNAPALLNEQVGLIWYGDDDNYIKLVKEMKEQPYVILGREENGAAKTHGRIAMPSETVSLRLTQEGGQITAYAKSGNDDWKVVGQCAGIARSPLRAGFYASVLPGETDRWATFRDFKVLSRAGLAHRMGTIVVHAAAGAPVRVEQLRHEFWFGATLPHSAFNGKAAPEDAEKWRKTFLENFNAGVIESAFKWHDMEKERGVVNYSLVDSMLAWGKKEDIPLRGHCIFWGVPKYVPAWLKELNDDELRVAVQRRARSVGARYRGEFAEYDLNNEMIHANYFEQRLGPEITKQMALWVKDGDPEAKLWVNDYDITTGKRLDDYVTDIRRLLDMGVPLAGIGVQGHLHGDDFDAEALRRSLDVLAQFQLPIRITEFNFPGQRSKYYGKRDVRLTAEEEQSKAKALKHFYEICFSHPAVSGIMMWGFWEGANWIPVSSLFARDWSATPAAAAYRELVFDKWWTRWSGTTDEAGVVTIPAFYGKHRVTVNGVERTIELTKTAGTVHVR